jgi:hypothetical protein
MKPLDQAEELLRQTEARLRSLMSEAAAQGDYGAVVQIASWGRNLSEVLTRGQTSDRPRSETPLPSARSSAPAEKTTGGGKGRRGVLSYPQFYRHGERLIRVAWSKRDKKEYEHKASLNVLTALTSALLQKGADGRVFVMEDILPLSDGEGTDIPSYQVYACISFLKTVGVLDQHGRQGYSVPRIKELESTVKAVWRKLPER